MKSRRRKGQKLEIRMSDISQENEQKGSIVYKDKMEKTKLQTDTDWRLRNFGEIYYDNLA